MDYTNSSSLKSSEISLFDLLVCTNSKRASLQQPKAKITKDDGDLKTFIVSRRKRKKRFTPLKKKILLERLRLHNKQINVDQSSGGDSQDLTVMKICNFVDPNELVNMEKEEFDELLENVTELVSPFGDIHIINFVDNCEFRVEFFNYNSAATALKVLDGWIIGGNSLRVDIVEREDRNQCKECMGSKDLIKVDEKRRISGDVIKKVDAHVVDVAKYNQSESESLTTVFLKNVLSLDDIIDKDELSEVLSDISILCSTLDLPVRRISVEKFNSMDTLFKEMRYFQDTYDKVISTLTGDPVGIIEMYSYEVSLSIVNFLNNAVVSDQKISARLLPPSDPFPSHSRVSELCNSTSSTSTERLQFEPIGTMILIEGLYSYEDLSIAKQDADEWVSLRSDLVQLALESPIVTTNNTTTLRHLAPEKIRRVSIDCNELSKLKGREESEVLERISETSSTVDIYSAEYMEEGVLAAVSFESPIVALQAMTALDGLVIGGNIVTAFLKPISYPLLPLLDVSTVTLNDNKYINDSNFILTDKNTTSLLQISEKPDEQSLKLNKLPKHNKLSENANTALHLCGDSNAISPISIPIIPSTANEIEDMIKVLLGKLSDFQSRALEKDPGIKAKKRFVLGLKQAITAVKTDRAKIVFVAPDTESSEALDAKLQLLLEEAQSHSIPIMYCMSRRRLGKAVGSHMRQSVVTVYDADGVYDLYKKIVAFVGLEVVSKNRY